MLAFAVAYFLRRHQFYMFRFAARYAVIALLRDVAARHCFLMSVMLDVTLYAMRNIDMPYMAPVIYADASPCRR